MKFKVGERVAIANYNGNSDIHVRFLSTIFPVGTFVTIKSINKDMCELEGVPVRLDVKYLRKLTKLDKALK